MSFAETLDRYFEISARGSNLSREVWGGILVFLSMAYIIVVNPAMMTDAGVDESTAFTATVIMAVVGTLIMALYAKFPVAQAPTMGMNAFIVYNVVLAMGLTWAEAMVAVFLSGIAMLLIAVSGVRKMVLDQIPAGLRCGITAGIGCFIVFIGLQNAGLVVDDASTLLTLGDLTSAPVALALFCIIFTLVLYSGRFPGAIFLGMLVTAVIGVLLGIIPMPEAIVSSPTLPDISAFLDGFSSNLLSFNFLMVVVAVVFVNFFDTTGTLMATGERAGLFDEEGNVKCERAIVADAAASIVSGPVGVTPTGSYAESMVGIEAGARTGLSALVVAMLFVAALFVGPLFGVIDYSCTVGAMVIVGAAMIASLKGVDWSDWPECVAVLGTMMFMVMTYSIADGIAFGAIFYCVCMAAAGRYRQVSPIIYVVAAICLLYFFAVALTLRGGAVADRMRLRRHMRAHRGGGSTPPIWLQSSRTMDARPDGR